MEELSSKVEKTIRNHTGLAMGAAIVPVPVADVVAISAIELDMLRAISKIYGKDLRDDLGKQIIGIAVAATVGGGIWGAILKLIPGIGSAAGGAIQMTVAGTICYALGYAYKSYVESDGVFDPEKFKAEMIYNMKSAKETVKKMKNEMKKKGAPPKEPQAT